MNTISDTTDRQIFFARSTESFCQKLFEFRKDCNPFQHQIHFKLFDSRSEFTTSEHPNLILKLILEQKKLRLFALSRQFTFEFTFSFLIVYLYSIENSLRIGLLYLAEERLSFRIQKFGPNLIIRSTECSISVPISVPIFIVMVNFWSKRRNDSSGKLWRCQIRGFSAEKFKSENLIF